jgi:hypothetical protein
MVAANNFWSSGGKHFLLFSSINSAIMIDSATGFVCFGSLYTRATHHITPDISDFLHVESYSDSDHHEMREGD